MDMPYKPWHFFAGTKARMVVGLKSMVFGDTNKTEIKAGTDDPTSVAQDMPAGSIYYDVTNKRALQKMDAGSTTNFRLLRDDEFTKEPTGFVDPDGITVTYSVTNRTITLSHSSTFVQFLLRGRLFVKSSPWTVCTTIDGATPIAHTNANGSYFLSIDPDTLAVSFGTSAWTFDKLQIALAFKNATAQFALRECHGLMPWQSHQENHSVNGTYLRSAITMTSGTAFTATTSSTATTASNCPGIEAGTIYDEDIPTLNAAWPEASYTGDVYNSGVYTTCYIGAAGAAVFDTAAQLPYLRAGGGVGILQYAPVTSGSGALTNVTEDSFMNVLVLSLPVTADSDSQKFRTVFLTGQQQFTTLSAAQLQAPQSWVFGEISASVPEYVAIQMYTYQYNAAGGTATPVTVLGRAFLAALPVTFTGSRASLTGFTGISPSDHQTLSNRSATDAHPATAISTTGFTTNLNGITTVQAALALFDTGTMSQVKAASSSGLSLQNNSGNACLLLGAGGGLGATFYDGVNVTGVLDQASAATLEIGKTNATAITLGKAGITTTNAGAFTSSQLLTATLGVSISGGTAATNSIALVSSAMRIGGGSTAGGSLDAGTTPVISWTSTAVTLAQATTIGALTTATNHMVQGTGDTLFTGWNSQFLVRDGAAGSAATNGGVISFGGSYDSGNNQTIFALIKGYKENGTSGNFQGGFKIGVRSGSGATLNTAIDCASTGAVTVGPTTGANHLAYVTDRLTLQTPNTTAACMLVTSHNGANKGFVGTQGTTDGSIITGYTADYALCLVGTGGVGFSANGGTNHGEISTAGAVTIPTSTTHTFGTTANDVIIALTPSGTNKRAAIELTPSDTGAFAEFNCNRAGATWVAYVASSTPRDRAGIQIISSGNVYNYNNTTTWNTVSDERIKTNIRDVNNGLEKILALRPRHFEYIHRPDGGTKTAFIAQEFERVLPGHVNEQRCPQEIAVACPELASEMIKGLECDLQPYLVQAVKELHAKLEAAEAEIKALKAG